MIHWEVPVVGRRDDEACQHRAAKRVEVHSGQPVAHCDRLVSTWNGHHGLLWVCDVDKRGITWDSPRRVDAAELSSIHLNTKSREDNHHEKQKQDEDGACLARLHDEHNPLVHIAVHMDEPQDAKDAQSTNELDR